MAVYSISDLIGHRSQSRAHVVPRTADSKQVLINMPEKESVTTWRIALLEKYGIGSANPKARRALAMAFTLRNSIRFKRPMRFGIDRDGEWSLWQPGAAIYSPTFFDMPLEAIEAQVSDHWLWARGLDAGGVVIDVGAGVGDEAIVLSRLVGPTGRVLAIEAHPRTFRCLEKTVRHSKLAIVTPLQLAIAEAEGELSISDGDNHLANTVVANGNVKVRARPLDAIVAEQGIDRIDLIKINIEGAETAALQGMPRALAMARQVVVSCHDFLADEGGDASTRTYETVIAQLRAAGFELQLRPGDPRPWVRYYVYATRA